MKHSFISLFVLAVCVLAVGSFVYSNGVGSGKMTKEKRDVAAFTKITFQLPGELILNPSSSDSLSVKGPKSVLDNVSTEVVNGELVIKAKDPTQVNQGSNSLWFEVGTSNLQQVTLNSSGRIRGSEEFELKNVTLIVDGSGSLFFAVKGNSVTAEVKGSGSLMVTGIIEEESVTVNGSGKYEGAGILTQNAKVVVNGSGKVWVTVMNKLDVTVAGKGVVRYGGTPTVTKKVSGGGKVIPFA